MIIEVAKEYEHAFNGTGWKRLLGKHKWSEILTDPSPEERELESRVFFCVYSSARDVEKKGDASFASGLYVFRLLILLPPVTAPRPRPRSGMIRLEKGLL